MDEVVVVLSASHTNDLERVDFIFDKKLLQSFAVVASTQVGIVTGSGE